MQSRKHLLATCSVLLIAALLAACAAPAAAPAPPVDTAVPPVDTPAPPAATSDPVEVVQAWVEAINNGDEDAVLALMTEDIDFQVWEYRAYGKGSLRQWILDWWVGLDTKYQIVTCESQENQVSCDMNVVDGCIAAFGATEGLPTKMALVVQEDGKISKIAGYLNGARWNDYFRTWSPLAQSWMQANRAAELRQIDPEPDRKQAGALQIKLCRDYENAVKTQEPATAVSAQGLVDAINTGDTNAALALFVEADSVSFKVMSDEAQGADQMLAMFDWFASKETQFQITDCEWQGIGTQCAVSLVDGCIAASGAPEGVNGKMTFYSQEDGTLRRVNVVMDLADRKPYESWLEAETAWASANRADDLAQAEGYSQEAGAMAVKLCREYAAAPKLDDATTAKIETLVEEIMASGQVPGAAVGIVKDGQLVYAKGFGVTELGGDEPVTADSVFGMASVAKSPVGMAVMQLVEAGKIDLDAPVTEYLPDFTMADPDSGAITIRQLLSHTSGMPDPVDRLAEYQDENKRTDEAALGDYVRTLSDDSLTFRPGEEWSYSDTGFDILGDVVAAVSGQTFEDYMQANILTPLGMKDSSYLLSDLDPAQLVAPQMYDENGNARTLDFYPYSRAHAPSASFYSSVNDMARLAIANMNQGTLEGAQVLPATAYDKMWAPQAASTWAEAFGPQVTNYGLGWWVGEFNGHTVIGNYGADVGFQSHLGIFPDDGIAVIALVNLFDPDAGTFYAYDIGNGVAETLLGVEAEPATQP